jgi:hypothetical protein
MTIRFDCAVAERLAGAIAIGDASDSERSSYRRHVAQCERCLRELGGEREIERVVGIVTRARDQERWEPDLRARLARQPRPHRSWIWATALAAVVALTVGLRTMEKAQPPAPTHVISAQESRALVALGTQVVPHREGSAESLTLGTTTVSTAVAVSLDARGMPVRCTITKSSGVRDLDQSVCRAAMHAHYPR